MPTTRSSSRSSSRRTNYTHRARVVSVTPSESQPTRQKPRRWTSTEDELLYASLRDKLAQPLKDTFLEIAQATNRTPASVQARWYSYVSYTDKEHSAYLLVGKNMVAINRKGFRNKKAVYQIPSGILGWIIERIL